MRRKLQVALLAAIVAVPAYYAITTVTANATVNPPPAGFTLTWSDDFNGANGTGVDTNVWKYDTGPGSTFGTGEIETMTSSTANVHYDGQGNLLLTALHSGSDPRAGWTSGRIETQSAGFGAAPGGVMRVESRLQQPNVNTANGAGYWPAFWMLGAPLRAGVSWPGSGEIDVMEDINGRSSLFSTLHCGVNPGGPCNESTGLGSGERACGGCQTGFHNYAVEVDRSMSPEQIRFYFDGGNFFTLNANQVDATTWSNAVDHPFFIIYDLAIGGGFPDAFGGGPFASTVSGASMVIDSVAVYNKGPGSTGGGSVVGNTILGPGGKCIDVSGDDTGGNGTPVQLWDCQTAARDQHWVLKNNGSIQTLGRCLDVTGGSTAGGAKLELWDCNGTGAQQWRTTTNGTLVNPASGKCLDSPSGATGNGTRLQIWDCNGSGAQSFVYNGGASNIVGPGGKCIDVAGDDNGTDGAVVQLWDCQDTSRDQNWKWSGSSLQSLGRCLDIAGAGTANGTVLQLHDCTGNAAQVWVDGGNGTLRNPQSGRCLDSPNGSTANGTRLQIWDCNGSGAQTFRKS
ncbi:ricin-type beta-trefoil lectin domain protein [Dactylosporangium matsuzakiense]|uniref:ricin-type beta-trefoil lectin domain protein n=1 Tax=Dactylosporangium matsuzakiense TaxID=53360 RepID=UPI0021C3C0DC|nr:ricin-type beta-trefoil lectin domain protein [Dactylosporangium matsuzakiense]UWZ45259.1 ricin-type beta-trefoil lectin domain protein [Dactylosporangium matsuzakiense]